MFLIITETKIYNENICLLNKFISYYRVDGYKEHFTLINLFHFGNGNFLTDWNMDNFHITYNDMFQNGLKHKTKSRTTSLSMYGSIIGATRYPQFIKDDKDKILQWPYHTSKPGNKEWKLVQSFRFFDLIKLKFWFLDFIKHIQLFNQIYSDNKK